MPEFVNLDGLTCLIKVGAEADQNYQNYILRGRYLGTGHFSSPGRKAGTQWGRASEFAWATLPAAARPCPWRGNAVQGGESSTPACCNPACHAVTLPTLCLAALSQIMLFVDGMQGVINHNETVQWLYTLSGSPVSPRCPCAHHCTPTFPACGCPLAPSLGIFTPPFAFGLGALVPLGVFGPAPTHLEVTQGLQSSPS